MSEEGIKPIEQQTEGLKPINDEQQPIQPIKQDDTIELTNEIQPVDDNKIEDVIVDEEDVMRNTNPRHARIQPVVVSKLIDIYNRMRDDVNIVSGFLSGHRAFDDVFDVFDLIVLSNDRNSRNSNDELNKLMEQHVKIFEEESFIGYFHLFKDIQEPRPCDIHNVFFYSNRSPLVLSVGMKTQENEMNFKIDAYFSPIEYVEREFKDEKTGQITKRSVKNKDFKFNPIDIVYPIDELDRLVIDAN